MKREKISRALGEIDTAYIEEAAQEPDHRKKPGKHWTKVMLPMAACVAIILTAALYLPHRLPDAEQTGMNQNGQENHTASSENLMEPAKDQTDRDKKESLEHDSDLCFEVRKTALQSNDAVLYPAAQCEIELLAEDFVPMSRDELLDYFDAVLPVSEVLPELQPAAANDTAETQLPEHGIYCRNRGTGAVYHDLSSFRFANADGSKQLGITLSKTGHHVDVQPCVLKSEPLDFTEVNGRELVVFRNVGQECDMDFYVEWMQNGVGWRVGAAGLHEKEFYRVLQTLVIPEEPIVQHRITGELIAIDPYAHSVGVCPEQGLVIRVLLPEDVELEDLTLSDKVTVTWNGEPALLQTVWKEQLVEFTPLKGE